MKQEADDRNSLNTGKVRADVIHPCASALGRRDLMKLGAGLGASMLGASRASAQNSTAAPETPLTETGPGYKNDANRSSGNGPMDDTTHQIVKWVHSFSEADVNNSLADSIGDVMVHRTSQSTRATIARASRNVAADACAVEGSTGVCYSIWFGAWRSLVAHLPWEQGVGRSNRLAPTSRQ